MLLFLATMCNKKLCGLLRKSVHFQLALAQDSGIVDTTLPDSEALRDWPAIRKSVDSVALPFN